MLYGEADSIGGSAGKFSAKDARQRELVSETAFAPLHTPPALSVIHFAMDHFPGVPQAACLDISFHVDMPLVASALPIPKSLRAEGIQRYGFHGLSYESIVHQLGSDLPDRAVIAHIGNGASVTAVMHGRSIDTSMGLTSTSGVIMGTRSGDLDPGSLLHLMREKNLDASGLEELVDHRSGLLGISGIGSDRLRCGPGDDQPMWATGSAAVCVDAQTVRQLDAHPVSSSTFDHCTETTGSTRRAVI